MSLRGFTDARTSPGGPMISRRGLGRSGTNARLAPRHATPEEQAMRQWLQPIPRAMYDPDTGYTDDELGAEIKRLYILKKADMAPRIALDLRLLRWVDPQSKVDTWQEVFSGKIIPKLFHNSGLATDNIPWSAAVLESWVGLLAGNKPMAYMYDVAPEDPASDADMLQADMVEKLIDRWVTQNEYPTTYQNHILNVGALGRSWKYVTTDADTLETTAELLWPGHVAAMWQPDRQTVEQVTIERQLTLDEALRLYGKTDEDKAAILSAMRPPNALGISQASGVGGTSKADRGLAGVTVLTHWYRVGVGKFGGTVTNGEVKPQIGMCAVLMFAVSGSDDMGSVVLYRDNDTGYEDIPAHCTPRMRISDRNPDESYGVLMMVAGLHTSYNEVFSAFRDMLWRTIYARYVAKGFTFRSAPRIIPGSAIYALPRVDQDFKRVEEAVNTVPIEQFLSHLEELIIVMPGLNRFFLGSAPPSETSGESITAAINASITRLEPVRTNVEEGERWTFRMVLAQSEAFHIFQFQGRTVTTAAIIEGKRRVEIHWRDVTPKDAEKAKRAAIEGVNAALMSRDTAMDEYNIHSKPDERRKIRKERQDEILSPSTVAATANALTQRAVAQAHTQAMQSGSAGPSSGAKIVLSGKLTPGAETAAEAQAGLGGGGGAQPPAQPGAGAPAPNAMQAKSDALSRVTAAQAAPRGTTATNTPGTAQPGGRAGRVVAPPAPGQVPGRPFGQRIGR